MWKSDYSDALKLQQGSQPMVTKLVLALAVIPIAGIVLKFMYC